jgi:CHAT domain-containing protein
LVMTSTVIRSALLDKAGADSAIIMQCGEAIRTALDTLESVSAPEATSAARAAELFRQDRERASFERIVNFYRYLLTRPRLKGRNLENFRFASRQLYAFLLGPLEQDLAGKTDLIILPDGILGFIPFETLLAADSTYLAQRVSIRYAQSLTVMDIIAGRKYDPNREPLAAFGGAVYQPATYAKDMARAETDYRTLKQAGSGSRGTDSSALSGTVWHNLPGTLVEVKMIKDIQDQAVVFTGDDVEESRIKKLSADGWMKNYKVLHFATHGQVDLARPELSSVVLSQYDPPRNGEDGYLRVSEVAGLDLNADMVNLSACETGLGKIYGGEGVVGLTQAFLLAGANGLSVSLWQVADESTMRFMVGIYRLVKQTGKPYPQAIAEIKRQFISGEIGNGAYQNPYFWAPFVYYGQ